MKLYEMKNEFVRRVLEELEDGVLYICLECDVVVHKCACGCGEKVVLPLAPEHWKLYYDGVVTLSPSIATINISVSLTISSEMVKSFG